MKPLNNRNRLKIYILLNFYSRMNVVYIHELFELFPRPLHLTTSKVMVIVWRLRGNIIPTVLYWQRATSSMGTVDRNSSYSSVGPWVFLRVFWVAWFIFLFMYVLFYLGQLSHFPSCFGAGVANLNEPPSSFLLSPHYCGLGAGSIPYRAIANNKQCEMRGLFMLLVINYWIGDVKDSQGVSASEMTYIVSGGALNSTHSLTIGGLGRPDLIMIIVMNIWKQDEKANSASHNDVISGKRNLSLIVNGFQITKPGTNEFCSIFAYYINHLHAADTWHYFDFFVKF